MTAPRRAPPAETPHRSNPPAPACWSRARPGSLRSPRPSGPGGSAGSPCGPCGTAASRHRGRTPARGAGSYGYPHRRSGSPPHSRYRKSFPGSASPASAGRPYTRRRRRTPSYSGIHRAAGKPGSPRTRRDRPRGTQPPAAGAPALLSPRAPPAPKSPGTGSFRSCRRPGSPNLPSRTASAPALPGAVPRRARCVSSRCADGSSAREGRFLP